MPSLAETAAMLASLKRRQASFESGELVKRAEDRRVGEGVWSEGAADPNPGALGMLFYTPNDLRPGAPLVVALHGCGQTAKGYAEAAGWTVLADRLGFALLAPEQSGANNASRCFNWFEPLDAQRDRGEAASIRAMIDKVLETHRLDRRRVFITGLSAGGAMTSVMLACYPETFAAGAVIAGLPFGVADNLQSALGAMYFPKAHTGAELAKAARQASPSASRPPRLSIWHGDADATVKTSNGDDLARQWALLHGLAEEPTEVVESADRTRALWRSAGNPEEVLVERHVIRGMGHGVPLAAKGPGGLGEAGPFMLEAGISSSLEIAEFWGLGTGDAIRSMQTAPNRGRGRSESPSNPRPRAEAGSGDQSAPASEADGVGAKVLASLSQIVSDDVRRVIEGAFRAARLK